MEGESILPSPAVISPTLDVGRAYNATDAAAILGITPYVLNERVRRVGSNRSSRPGTGAIPVTSWRSCWVGP